MRRISTACVLVACALGTMPVSTRSQTATFRAQSELVVLHVNVFDGRSDAVDGLPQSAFSVVENDLPQDITFFNSANVPVAAGLVLDNSSSMITRRGMVLAGGTAFVESSHPEDELFTVNFNEHVRFGLPPTMPFTRNSMHLRAAMTQYRAGGKTALHDAVIAGLDHLERASHQKRVLVVLSDGDDNASARSEDEMLERARHSDAIVYAVSSADYGSGQGGNPGVLRKLADITGGLAYFPKSDVGVVEGFNRIAANIRRGYSIGYVPPSAGRPGEFRKVKVRVRVKGRNNLTVRARDGYAAFDDRSR